MLTRFIQTYIYVGQIHFNFLKNYDDNDANNMMNE